MNMNVNRLAVSKREALLNNRTSTLNTIANILINYSERKDLPMRRMLISNVHHAYLQQLSNIRSVTHDAFDVLDCTFIGTSYPVTLTINTK